MRRVMVVALAALVISACNVFDKAPTEPMCTPIDFGVPDSLAIVNAEVCI